MFSNILPKICPPSLRRVLSPNFSFAPLWGIFMPAPLFGLICGNLFDAISFPRIFRFCFWLLPLYSNPLLVLYHQSLNKLKLTVRLGTYCHLKPFFSSDDKNRNRKKRDSCTISCDFYHPVKL